MAILIINIPFEDIKLTFVDLKSNYLSQIKINILKIYNFIR